MGTQAHFSRELFRFFRDLNLHNDRTWFQANKWRYEECVKAPMLAFIGDMRPHLRKISRHLVADPRPVGGSMFRIYRDTRFSNDKRPYKTHVAAVFRHDDAGDGSHPGFYLHIGVADVYAGGGLWHPAPDALQKVREAIVASPRRWRRATAAITVSGETLKRPPRGFSDDHPLIEDVKRKDFVAGRELTERDVCSPRFIDKVVAEYRRTAPFIGFLCRALDLRF